MAKADWPTWKVACYMDSERAAGIMLVKAATPAGAVTRGLAHLVDVIKPTSARYVRQHLRRVEVRKA